MKKAIIWIIVLVLVLAAILTYVFTSGSKNKDTITIVNKNYTEQRLVGEMLGQYLASLGYDTEVKELGGSMLCFNALQSGDADMYNEYTGTMYSSVLKKTEVLGAEETYKITKELSEKEYGITWLEPLGFNNTYALAVTSDFVEKYGVKTISDLEPFASSLLIGGDSEFGVREIDGLPAVEKKYGFKFKSYKSMDQGITYTALVNGEIDVNSAYATDGRIAKYNLVQLVDDKSVFPPYYCTPIMKQSFAEEHPDVVEALNKLKNMWSDTDMQNYNLMVDEGADVKDVAKKMLEDRNLI